MPAAFRWTSLACLLCVWSPALARDPVVTDDRLVLELVAREPDIVTPTGLAVDEKGRVWVLENHTHQRPPNYKGPTGDRIRIFSDFDETGKARRVTTFAEGFKNSMGIALARDGSVYYASRSEILLLRDHDGKAGERKTLARLETKGDYPHNGLSGFAFDGTGMMYFGMGENLGAPYKLVGSDGTTLSGGGEGGNMYSCRPDGSKLTRVATGFWNPFHHCVDAFGRLFAVDNDPDARGPCRLLHVVPGGDYGYRFRYGRKGTHPFQAWNGELPGTLGMVAGTGEAPSGVVAYESTGLPAEYRGCLLSTSWGDHLVEVFQLVPSGASFRARTKTLVRGGEDFRPVGIAVGPDGAVYLSDWVDKSYPVHGKGRIWRLRMKKPPEDDGPRPAHLLGLEASALAELLGHPKQNIRAAATVAFAEQEGHRAKNLLKDILKGKREVRAKLHALWAAARIGREAADLIETALNAPEPEVRAEAVRLLPAGAGQHSEDLRLERALKDPAAPVRMQAVLALSQPASLRKIVPLLADPDPFLVSAAAQVLGQPGNSALLLSHTTAADPRLRLGVLLALRRTGDADGRAALGKFLEDPDPEIRRTAIQWVGEEKLKNWIPQLSAAAMKAPVTRDLFLALVAANHLLAGGKPDADPVDEKLLVRVVQDEAQPPVFRVLALQLLPPDHPALSVTKLGQFVGGKDAALQREAIRTLALRSDKAARELLLQLAADDKVKLGLRGAAVGGLASAASSPEVRQVLLSLLERPELRRDALRSLRSAAGEADVEKALLAWWDRAAAPKSERPELAGQLLLALSASKTREAEKRRVALALMADPRPKDEAGWRQFLASRGDPAAGERVFFHGSGPRCAVCHRVDGRGGKVGPDLSAIGRALSRDRLIESILTPSKEIAPMFVSWSLTTRDGKVHSGVVVEESFNSIITLADAQGRLEKLNRQDVEERVALPTSLMPDKLHEQMTPQEFRDLIAYLTARK